MSTLTYTVVGLAIVGVIFCGVYATDSERRWWAIIPGLAAFTLLVASLADAYIGTDPANDWASVLVIAAGAAITASMLRRDDAKRVLTIIADFALVIGILMTPLDLAAKSAVAAVVGGGGGLHAVERRQPRPDAQAALVGAAESGG